jgi:hypothetical protein
VFDHKTTTSSGGLGVFEPDNIFIYSLNAEANLKSIDLKNLDVALKSLSFNEKSGFRLENLKFALNSDNKVLKLKDLSLKLPGSEITAKTGRLDYTGLEISNLMKGAEYSLAVSGKFHPADLAAFAPLLADYGDLLTFGGEISGRLPAIHIPALDADYGDVFSLSANVNSSDVINWRQAYYEIEAEKIQIARSLVHKNLDKIVLSGQISGNLPDMKVDIQGKGSQGALSLKGKGGWQAESGNFDFDANIDANNLNISALLGDSVFGISTFTASAQGKGEANSLTDAVLSGTITRFDYRGYSYQNAEVSASYEKEHLALELNSADENLPLALKGSLDLGKQSQKLTAHADLGDANLARLNLLSDFPNSKLRGNFDLDVQGFNPEKMDISMKINSLTFSTQKGSYSESPLTLSYTASADNKKLLNVRSKALNFRGQGDFSYEGLKNRLADAFPAFFEERQKKKKPKLEDENFSFAMYVRQVNRITSLFADNGQIPDSAFVIGKYTAADSLLNLDATAFCLFTAADSARVHLNLANSAGNLSVNLDATNKSPRFGLKAALGAEINFERNAKNPLPDINIALAPGSVSLNETDFSLNPAQISISGKRLEISNFALRHSFVEYLKIDGTISDSNADSLLMSVSNFQIATLMSASKAEIPLSGRASGDVVFRRLLDSPRILSRNFAVDDIYFDNNLIGNLKLTSIWSSERQGARFRASLVNAEQTESLITGIISPEKDSLSLSGDIQGLKLNWFADYLASTIYGLEGEAGAKFQVTGRISDPKISGTAFLKNATAGVRKLGTLYLVSDSVQIEPDQLVFNDFTIKDAFNRTANLNGRISHHLFNNLNPQLTAVFNNFSVLNNASQTDSLFYGTLQVNGKLNITKKNKNWLVEGNLSNGRNNTVMVNLPETPVEARRYNWISFSKEEEEIAAYNPTETTVRKTDGSGQDFALPLKLNLNISIDQQLTAGAVYSQSTGDAARVSGRGNIVYNYDLNNGQQDIQGSYTVESGKCTVSLKNITKKTFSVEEGGKLTFHGDPMKTAFDLTAVYSLRANPATLDASFAEVAGSQKIPVECQLTANGTMDKMKLDYNIVLPNETDDVQKKLDGLLYSDNLKIKEMAYLLAFGFFAPAESESGSTSASSNIWASLASSSVTAQLNNLLSGVLSDNWTIGTDLHADDADFSGVDMDVNISTRLFDDRLTVNSTLGYHDSATQTSDGSNNITGDFDLEYKIFPSGNLLLRFFNLTNNQFYEKAKTTQGVGIVYKKQGKSFGQLFRNIGVRKRPKEQTDSTAVRRLP